MSASIRLLLLSLMLSVLGGCASWGSDDWREPQLRLVKVQKVKATMHQQRFILHVRVDNPNDSRLFIRNLDFDVRLNDIPLIEDNASLWRSVAAHEQRTFKIEVRTNLWRHLKPLVKVIRRKQPVPYQLSGELNTGMLFYRSLHFWRSGEIIPGDFH
ncbi:LEA type 2 family protein [Pseudomonas cremoricolorata]|uniref:LEA type 2 family protein n=1 Tax=Pseudomonas cremoricolorata TaxID=157783 RepID=UPI000401E63B|nr:LEA type 2 family protein [Pseudomonas cremoricolorata]